MKSSKDREQQLNAILQAVADAILIVNSEGVVCYANAAAETIFGRRVADIVGHSFGLPILSGDTTELDIVQSSGNVITAELRAVATTWNGQPACVASVRDITARKRAADHAQQLIREQMARAQAENNARQARFLVEASNALSSTLDYAVGLSELARVCTEYYADWCVIDVVEMNGELKRVAVAQRDPEAAHLARELGEIAPELQPLPQEPEVLRSGEPLIVDDLEPDVRDSRYREVIERINPQSALMVPLISRTKTLGVMALFSAESRRHYTQADLDIAAELGRYAAVAIDNSRLLEEAQSANEAKSNFLAVVSHELRTPLNAVIGYSDLLTLGVPAPIPAEAKSHVARIRGSARHLLHLIEEILTFSRMETGRADIELTSISVGELAQDVAGIIQPMAQDKDLKFVLQLPEQDYTIQTDTLKIEQILLNLLSNAVKFTPQGKIELDIVPVDGWTHFHVKDSGIGIAPDHLEQIFEPFWQAEQTRTRRAEGTGLGLSVARRLTQVLGGNLVVQSAPAVGSTFTLQLPNDGPPEAPGQ